MMFNESSKIVKTWVKLVRDGNYTRQQVPDLDNLREIVFGMLNETEE